MSRAVWIAKKNHLCCVIKKVSDHYGGDDVEWLRAYAKDVVDAHPDDIEVPLRCFESLARNTRIVTCGTLDLKKREDDGRDTMESAR